MKKNKRCNIKYTMAAVLFCIILSLGITCFADAKGTVIVPSAIIRASADLSSEQLASVSEGGTVDIICQTTGTDGNIWYQVYVDANTKGFIKSTLVSTNGESIPSMPSASASDQPDTTATPVENRKGTVTTNNVRIRKGASTNHDIVGTANRGAVVTVTGEASGSDGKVWYQVSFTSNNKEITGFIRSDFVSFDNVPEDSVESQITGEENNGETEPQDIPEDGQPQDEEQLDSSSDNPTDAVLMNVDETPYVMPGFKPVVVKWHEEKINAYTNGKFLIYYARMPDGEEGWYLYDTEKDVYQRYVYTDSDSSIPDDKMGSVGLIPVIILIVIVIILAAVVGLLAIKLRSYDAYDDDYDDDEEDYSDDDIDDFEDLDEDEEDPQPIRRPQPVRRPQPQSPQPAKRPQPQRGNAPQSPQPARRPQPQGGTAPQSPQPARRPQPQGGTAPQSPQPARRPQPQEGSAPLGHPQGDRQPARRPQPKGENTSQSARPTRPASAQGHPQGGRPQPQGKRPLSQKSSKAANAVENNDDIDIMDI